MKLLDPLQAYKIASKIIYLQLAFFMAILVLWIKGELDLNSRDYAIGALLVVHITCYSLELFTHVMAICEKDLGALK